MEAHTEGERSKGQESSAPPHTEFKASKIWNNKRTGRYTPVIPATWKVEAGGLQGVSKQPRDTFFFFFFKELSEA